MPAQPVHDAQANNVDRTSGFSLGVEALGVKFGGGATVLQDFLEAAISDERIAEIHLFCSPLDSQRFELQNSPKIIPVECSLADSSRLYRLWWMDRSLQKVARKRGCDALLTLSGCGIGGGIPHVSFIQQSLPFSVEAQKCLTRTEQIRIPVIRGAMRRSCASSAGVIVQSDWMKNAVAETFGVAPTRIEVIRPSARVSRRPTTQNSKLDTMRGSRAGYRLLYVGHEAPYKNTASLFKAVNELSSRIPNLSLTVTLPAPRREKVVDGVIYAGYLNESDLAEALSLADVLVMPSLQETVGLPLLEAMTHGTPIIAADRPYAREMCSTAALFFDPLDTTSLVATIERAISDRELRCKLIAEGYRISAELGASRPYSRMVDCIVRWGRQQQSASNAHSPSKF